VNTPPELRDGKANASKSRSRHYAGDVARVIRESMRQVHGSVALTAVTAPSDRGMGPADVEAWNVSAGTRWRALNARVRVEMQRRWGLRPPQTLVRVAQRQARGLDHLHIVWGMASPDSRERIGRYVALYREHCDEYGFGYIDDPLMERHPKLPGGRPDPSRPKRNMVFRSPAKAGSYIGRYVSGGQLERYLDATDRSWRPMWVHPALIEMSGWSLERCKWIRQAWYVRHGMWGMQLRSRQARMMAHLKTRLPSWWHRDEQRAWVCSVTGWDGVPGESLAVLVA
jgi:hypothetical protein